MRYIDGVCVCVTNLIEAKKSLENCESWSWSSMIMIFSQTYTHRERKIQWWQPTKLSITGIIRLWFYKRNVCDWNTIHKEYISIQNRLIIIIGWLFQSKQKKTREKKIQCIINWGGKKNWKFNLKDLFWLFKDSFCYIEESSLSHQMMMAMVMIMLSQCFS